VAQGKKKRCSIRFGKNPHELRDTFKTLSTKMGANSIVAEYLMGVDFRKSE
jgi:hypothetical protein